MPNGKVGDHWYTDLLDHQQQVFTPGVDELIRRLDTLKREEVVALVDQAIADIEGEVGELRAGHLSMDDEFRAALATRLEPVLQEESQRLEERLPADRNRFL